MYHIGKFQKTQTAKIFLKYVTLCKYLKHTELYWKKKFWGETQLYYKCNNLDEKVTLLSREKEWTQKSVEKKS